MHFNGYKNAGGRSERTSAPWVILVINVSMSLVGLISLRRVFQMSSTMAWQGQENVEPLQIAKDRDCQRLKTLHFHFSDPRSDCVHRKANTIKRGRGVS